MFFHDQEEQILDFSPTFGGSSIQAWYELDRLALLPIGTSLSPQEEIERLALIVEAEDEVEPRDWERLPYGDGGGATLSDWDFHHEAETYVPRSTQPYSRLMPRDDVIQKIA